MKYEDARILPTGTIIICTKPEIRRPEGVSWCPVGTKFVIIDAQDYGIKVIVKDPFCPEGTSEPYSEGRLLRFGTASEEWDCYEVFVKQIEIKKLKSYNRLSFL